MDLTIAHLFDYPDHRGLVASWIYEAFWRERPESGFTAATLDGYLKEASDPDRIPLSLLALVDGRPAGTVNLVEDDVFHRPGMRPWLAALVVVPEFRRAGIGSALVRACVGHAARLEIAALYLGTDIPDFYRAFGAETVERDGDLDIMRMEV